MFVNLTPENLKYMDMTAEHGNFPLFQTKRILDIVVLYSFSNNGVEILHFIILIWNFPLFGRYTLKISVLPIFACMQISPLKNLNLRL